MTFFDELKEIHQKLQSPNIDFEKESYKLLTKSQLAQKFNSESFFSDFLELELPQQYYAEGQFGEYNITLFNQNNISAQVYFMDSIPTEIHTHPFVGSFMILKGESIETEFEFSLKEKLQRGLDLGHLSTLSTRKLSEGDVSSISQDKAHQLNRLSKKNVTLLLAKKVTAENSCFLFPNIKIYRPMREESAIRKLDGLFYLFRTSESLFKIKAQEFTKLLSPSQIIKLIYNLPVHSGKKFGNEFLTILKQELKKQDETLFQAVQQHEAFLAKQKKKISLIQEEKTS